MKSKEYNIKILKVHRLNCTFQNKVQKVIILRGVEYFNLQLNLHIKLVSLRLDIHFHLPPAVSGSDKRCLIKNTSIKMVCLLNTMPLKCRPYIRDGVNIPPTPQKKKKKRLWHSTVLSHMYFTLRAKFTNRLHQWKQKCTVRNPEKAQRILST